MGWVLYVEDNESLRSVVAEMLSDLGHELALAADGAAALEVLSRREPPFVIITDLHMPVMNGWELITRLQADPRLAHVPLVVASSETEPVAGVEAHLAKPYALGDLLRLVEQYRRRSKLTRAS